MLCAGLAAFSLSWTLDVDTPDDLLLMSCYVLTCANMWKDMLICCHAPCRELCKLIWIVCAHWTVCLHVSRYNLLNVHDYNFCHLVDVHVEPSVFVPAEKSVVVVHLLSRWELWSRNKSKSLFDSRGIKSKHDYLTTLGFVMVANVAAAASRLSVGKVTMVTLMLW